MTTLGLRARFSLAMLAWVTLGLLAVGLSASALFRSHVEQVFHAELEEHLVELIGLTEIDAGGRPRLARPVSDPRFGARGSGYYWQISHDDGLLLRSPSLGTASLDDRLAHSEGITHIRAPGPAGPAMVYGMTRRSTGGETLHFLVATDTRHLEGLVADFRRDLLVWLAALAAALILGAALALQLATRPLDRLGAAVAAVRAGNARRMGKPWPSEIAPLAADLDRLLDSREAMVAAARIESGNLAHGLRTSLAVLTDEAETLADQPAGATLLAECRRIARQLDWHLARARAAAGQGPVRNSSLPAALAPLLSAMTRLHQGRDIRFTANGPEASLAIDPEAFAEILSNLLDNAGKWASAEVDIDWQTSAGRVTLQVTDDGPGIQEGALERLFVPGVRLDEQVPGHGLGLAIARDLAEAAHGTLVLAPRADGRSGTTAMLTLHAGANS
ncbi:sensor histidine kinase [Polymorphobacter sp.]|uniref:sensor histidine kinase n=1 Tax=Polymorphobacter sp. TaxID=1909290 RepID=UPI003F72E3A8